LAFLLEQLPGLGRNKVKSLLEHGQVSVNGEVITRFDHPLEIGRQVVINRNKTVPADEYSGLKILFEDKAIIVIEKEAGLLSVASEKEKEKTAFRILSGHVKIQNLKNRIFTVHRLDRESSGVMMFAKTKEIQTALQENWEKAVRERLYTVVVEGRVRGKSDTITSWLKENKIHRMYSSPIPGDGQKSVTHYKVLKTNDKYSLLEVLLETGRKNQIRVHMQDIGHPVVGDEKYGAISNPLKRLGLHAHVLTFYHPVTGEEMRFESPVPKQFLRLF
jgi:23S rRNA pseudouridine1911/1915/1917 synthase